MTATADARSICRTNPMLLPAHNAKASPAPTRASIQATSAIVVSPGLPNGYRLWSAPSTLLDGRSQLVGMEGRKNWSGASGRPGWASEYPSPPHQSAPHRPALVRPAVSPDDALAMSNIRFNPRTRGEAPRLGMSRIRKRRVYNRYARRIAQLSDDRADGRGARVDRCHDTVDDGGHVDRVADPGHDRAQDGKPIRIRCHGGQRILNPERHRQGVWWP